MDTTPLWYKEPREKGPSRANFVYLPRLSLLERDRRWAELKRKMVMRGLNGLVFFGNDAAWGRGMVNFRYVTHFGSGMGGWAVFPLEGEPVIFNAPIHMSVPYSIYCSLQDWVSDIRPNAGVGGVIEYIKEKHLDRGRLGIAAYSSANAAHTLPHVSYTKLTQGLPQVSFSDETILIEEMRLIKSPEEIAFLEKAGELAHKKVQAMIEAARPGLTEAELWTRMFASDVINGGEPQVFNLLSSDNVFDEDPGYKHLLHGSEQPGSPTMRPLRNGDLIISEFHSVYGGYMAATEFSVFIGKPPAELEKIHSVCMEALKNAEAMLKPGNTGRQVWEAMRGPVERLGFDYVELGFHGHGLASPEFPTSVYRPGSGDLSGDAIADLPLEENMVIGTNIDVHNPAWRKDVGLQFGDMYHVTRNGARPLVKIPTDFVCTKP
jgi:Xaa-Pro aminopeptidase